MFSAVLNGFRGLLERANEMRYANRMDRRGAARAVVPQFIASVNVNRDVDVLNDQHNANGNIPPGNYSDACRNSS